MKKNYRLSLHVFRRDLRLQDNTALIEALRSSESVMPCFIFDPRQLKQNTFKSDHAIAFMRQSLHELDQALQNKAGRLYYFEGIPADVIERLLSQTPIEAVYVNRDYTPFSIQRDQQIEKICKQHRVAFHSFADALLNEPEHVLKANNEPYTVYTAYRNKAIQALIQTPVKNTYRHYDTRSLTTEKSIAFLPDKSFPALAVKGGRKEGIALLKHISSLKYYEQDRDIPAKNATTHLSAHNKFGTISIREFYHTLLQTFSKQHTLVNELYWRDFFTQIAYHYPRVFGHAFHEKYDRISWQNNENWFRAWREGRTGFPIVDAGMRELNTTGYMHNRVRMITASFLVKDLHIDWRWGEQYFAQQLVDYDPAVNNGNWQWAASTGCDAQPYFRIFNPWLQQQKFDPDCLYIKRFIHELSALSPQAIHSPLDQNSRPLTNYPKPLVDHASQAAAIRRMYKIDK